MSIAHGIPRTFEITTKISKIFVNMVEEYAEWIAEVIFKLLTCEIFNEYTQWFSWDNAREIRKGIAKGLSDGNTEKKSEETTRDISEGNLKVISNGIAQRVLNALPRFFFEE